jgi:hypothetical protein
VTAHNTIATDETNQPRTTDNNLLAFRDEPQLKLAAAGTTQAPSGTKWIRAVLLVDDYAVVWDDLQSTNSHMFDWFFHAFGDKLELSGVAAGRPVQTRKHGEFPYPFITGVRAQPLTRDEAEANWILPDKTGIKVWLMGGTNDCLFTARCPTTDGKTIPMVVLRKKGTDCQFISVLEPWKKKPVPLQISTDHPASDILRLTTKQPARTDVVTFEPAGIKFDFDCGGPGEKTLDVPLTPAQ